MAWEDNIIKSVNKKLAMEQQINEHRKRLSSAIEATFPTIKEYCEKFSNTGMYVTCGLDKSSVNASGIFITADINIRFSVPRTGTLGGSITAKVTHREPGQFEKTYTFPYISVHYGAQGLMKFKKYNGPIPEADIKKWIKCAARQESFLDHVRWFIDKWSE